MAIVDVAILLRQDSAPPTPAADWPRLALPPHQAHAVHAQLPAAMVALEVS